MNRNVSAVPTPPAWLTPLLAAACGLVVANLYYAQPLAGPISQSLGLSPQLAGLIVTMTQVGYGLGLLLIVPLGDLLENRRLVTAQIVAVTAALLLAAFSTHALPFLAAAWLIGIGSVAVQVMVPFAAHFAPEHMRGQVVGNVMSGLMFGIMLARPVASFVADLLSWHAVFALSAAVMVLLATVLWRTLPERRPEQRIGYLALLASLGRLWRNTPALRRRALYQACLFAAFSLFWTVTPLLLASPAFGLSQSGIALFALVGVAGALCAPVAGRLADRGLTRAGSATAMVLVAAAFALTHLAPAGSHTALTLLVLAGVVLDAGVTANLVLGQRLIYMLGAEQRSRLNGLYMATFFAGGAIGSTLGAWAYAHGGWTLASSIGLALPLAALLYFSTEARQECAAT
ncbi:MFS transporter [Azorhizophilus paspali]|uniref:MFS transporter n=1 Tax=Azorhizophilus paspali TaxID=69963 RepID=A0ABV6SF36_AZOPA